MEIWLAYGVISIITEKDKIQTKSLHNFIMDIFWNDATLCVKFLDFRAPTSATRIAKSRDTCIPPFFVSLIDGGNKS